MKLIRNTYNTILDFFYNLKRIWGYSKILWKDRDWDWVYILRLLQYKLSRTRKSLTHYVGAEKDKKRIRICELLIARIIRDEYCEVQWKEHKDTFGELKMTFDPPEEIGSEKCCVRKINLGRTKVNDSNRALEREKSIKIHEHENYMLTQDINYLFHIMSKHLTTWWD